MDKEEFHKTLGEKERKLYTRFSTLLEISETVFHEFGNHDYWGYNLTLKRDISGRCSCYPKKTLT